MLAAGIQPDFERPKAPERLTAPHLLVTVGFAILFGLAAAGALPALQHYLGAGP